MFDADELAGMVDCFGALTREELVRACSETAFRRGEEFEEADAEAAIDDAVDEFVLVEHDGHLVPGPGAFPTLPDGAEDLPHIMDVEERGVDREALAESVTRRFRAETATAVDEGDAERCRLLLDRTYDFETWGPVELDDVRDGLDDALEDLESE